MRPLIWGRVRHYIRRGCYTVRPYDLCIPLCGKVPFVCYLSVFVHCPSLSTAGYDRFVTVYVRARNCARFLRLVVVRHCRLTRDIYIYIYIYIYSLAHLAVQQECAKTPSARRRRRRSAPSTSRRASFVCGGFVRTM